MMTLTEDELREAFEYLDELRGSGRTNMFGAGAYLEGEMGWDRNDARLASKLWRRSFGEGSVEDRIKLATAQ